jgi:hypothetical protein
VEPATFRDFEWAFYTLGSLPSILLVLNGLKKYNQKLRSQLIFTGVALGAVVVASPVLDPVIDRTFRLMLNLLEDVLSSCLPSFAADDVTVQQGLQFIHSTRSAMPLPSVFMFVCAGNIAIQEHLFTALKASNENRRRIMNGRVAAAALAGIVAALAAHLSSTRGILAVMALAAFSVLGLSIYFMQLPSHQSKWGKFNHVLVMVLTLSWTELLHAAMLEAFPDSTLTTIGLGMVTWWNYLLAVLAPFCVFNRTLESHVLVRLIEPPKPARAPPVPRSQRAPPLPRSQRAPPLPRSQPAARGPA